MMNQYNHYANRHPTMSDVERACDESDAVESYQDTDSRGIEITWCDGTTEIFSKGNEHSAINAISAMSAN